MSAPRTISVDLGDGSSIAVLAEPVGAAGALVSDEDVIARLDSVTESIEKVCRSLMNGVRNAAPQQAEVEVTFGLAIEAGQLVALLGKAKGEASIRVLLTWDSGR